MQDLREDIKHREDQRTTALSLTELIVKEGDENWSDELLEGLGPWFMVQLADLANFFESMRKYVPQYLILGVGQLTCTKLLRMAGTPPDNTHSGCSRPHYTCHRSDTYVAAGQDRNLCYGRHLLRTLPNCRQLP